MVCTYISPPTESLIDVPVFPPRTEEEEQAQINGTFGVRAPESPDSDSIEKVGVTIDSGEKV